MKPKPLQVLSDRPKKRRKRKAKLALATMAQYSAKLKAAPALRLKQVAETRTKRRALREAQRGLRQAQRV